MADSDSGVCLSLLTPRVAGQLDGRSIGGLIGQGSGGETVESQASTDESVGSDERRCVLPGAQAGHGGVLLERGA